MKLKELFVSRRRLRPLWRIFVFFIFSFLLLQYLTLILWEKALVRYVLLFFILLGLTFIFVRFFDKRPSRTIGFAFHSRWLKEYLQGLSIGLACVSCLFFIVWFLGFYEVKLPQVTLILIKNIFLISLVTTCFQSAFEELLFRGYLFQNLILATNAVFATAVLSLLFGLGHLLTPHSRWITAVNLSVFGVLHALAYLKTRSLWLPSGFHFGWNFFMRNIYSLPCSGTMAGSSLLIVKESGPPLVTGAEYGPEAGIPALLVLMAACFVVVCWRKIKMPQDVQDDWKAVRS